MRRGHGALALPRGTRCRGVERAFIEGALAGYAAEDETIALIADPGMGKTQLAAAIAWRIKPYETMWIELGGLDADAAAARLIREARRIGSRLRSGAKICAIIDDVPPTDEYEAGRMARSITRLRLLGAKIILTMLPEAEQFLEALDDCMRAGKSDLMVRPGEVAPIGETAEIMRVSGGIPELVGVLQDHAADEGVPLELHPAFGEALCRIVRRSLRDTLLEQDRIIRFCALLLGSGTWDELGRVAGGYGPEAVEAALGDCVVASVGPGDRIFSCVGVGRISGLLYCSDAIASAAGIWPVWADAAIDRLVERGEIERVARITGLLGADRRATVALKHGIVLIDAGETGLVREALAMESFSEEVSPYARGLLSQAYDALWATPFVERESVYPRKGFASERDERCAERVHLLALSRRMLGDLSCCPSPVQHHRSDRMAAGLALHIEALRLLGQGRPADCYGMLMAHQRSDGPCTLSEALLAIDRAVSGVLMCEAPSGDEPWIRRSEAFFERMGATSVSNWGSIVGSAASVIAGCEPVVPLGDGESVAERCGNRLAASALGCLAALEDLSHHAAVGAHVRAQRAERLAIEAGCAAVADVAVMLHAVASGLLKDPDAHRPLIRRSWSCKELEDIGRAVCAVLSDEYAMLEGTPLPVEHLWLVRALAGLPEPFSRPFRAVLPSAWRMRLAELEDVPERPEQPREARIEPLPEPVPASPVPVEEPITINVLGGFSLSVNGCPVSDTKLGGRSARTVLAFLAAVPQHTVPRIKLIEAIWPDDDLVGGQDRIYQSSTRIRSIVREIDRSLNPIVLVRNSGMIGLNAEEVRCDVDILVELAHRVISREGSDEEVVEAARRVDEVYRGDLFIPIEDVSGIMRSRARELRKLYTDTMVLGSEAALRLRKRLLATHFAESAHVCDAGREDAVRALIRALRASGRNDEAVACYRAFVKRLMRGSRRMPSSELRAAIGDLLVGHPSSSEAEEALGA
ncbi:MAG: BTAD domain-containing putative transcriptional regulator [Coriobacteriaceae bacterium]|nr:BTAD domain-containing putative transcriptional regulator [Coriobacteriaceae bacterium]